MKIQFAAISVALLVVAMTIPPVRSTVFAAIPSVEDNDNCGKIVCSDEPGQPSRNSPEIKFKPR